MTIIVNNGATLRVTSGSGFAITSVGTIVSGGLTNGPSMIPGASTLLNLGTISADVTSATSDIDSGTITNQGTIAVNGGSLTSYTYIVTIGASGDIIGPETIDPAFAVSRIR